MAAPTHAPAAPHRRGRKAKADAGLNVCLDYLKGKCTREQCRFVHPDLTAYQQLSEAVEAQAGREICEVWAMTGQCKFGAKCNKLHPVMVDHPAGQTIAVPSTPQPAEAESPADGPPSELAIVPMTVVTAAPDLAAEFEQFAKCMQKTLLEEEEYCWQPSGKALAGKELSEETAAPQYSAARRFLQSVLGVDSALIDIFRDLNLVAC
eukprot:EG_transcript_21293